MARKNSRRALLQLSPTLNGPYTDINGTHGFTIEMPTNFSDSSAHGQRFETSIPGLQGFSGTITKWYDTASTLLEDASLNKIPYHFRAYPDRGDTLNYYRGQCYIGMESENMDLGNTIDQSYTLVLADEDVDIIRGGVSLLDPNA